MAANMGEIAAFGKTLEVIENRIKVINQMLGYGCVGSLENPLRMRLCRGRYRIDLCGDEFQSFAVWDCVNAEKALNMLEGLNEGIWLLKRSRKISCTTK